jgi:uncharacterized DUF497 family protein
MLDLQKITGFEWDEENIRKNWLAHAVHYTECEEAFFQKPLSIYADHEHSTAVESRYQALGRTVGNRLLSIIFTVRGNKIRVISARDMSKKERAIYHENQEH